MPRLDKLRLDKPRLDKSCADGNGDNSAGVDDVKTYSSDENDNAAASKALKCAQTPAAPPATATPTAGRGRYVDHIWNQALRLKRVTGSESLRSLCTCVMSLNLNLNRSLLL